METSRLRRNFQRKLLTWEEISKGNFSHIRKSRALLIKEDLLDNKNFGNIEASFEKKFPTNFFPNCK